MHSNAFSSRRIIPSAEKRRRVNICKTAQLIGHKIFQLSRIARLAHFGPIPDLSRGDYAHCCIWYSCIVRSTGRLQREISVPIDGRALARRDRDRTHVNSTVLNRKIALLGCNKDLGAYASPMPSGASGYVMHERPRRQSSALTYVAEVTLRD